MLRTVPVASQLAVALGLRVVLESFVTHSAISPDRMVASGAQAPRPMREMIDMFRMGFSCGEVVSLP
jgi:hypothetical protein